MFSLTDLTPAQLTARDVWTSGDYAEFAERLISDFGPALVDEVPVRPGQRVLDVACGAGNVAIPAALAGAEVTAVDITPALLERGKLNAWEAGAEVTWVEGDAEALRFPSASFDVVLSAVGVTACDSHERAAAELLRVCRPGGEIGLIAWTPEGTIGAMWDVVARYVPPRPPGARPSSLWGTEQYVSELLGDGIDELYTERRTVEFDDVTADAFVDLMRTSYGPIVRIFERLEDDPARSDQLDAALREFARDRDRGEPGRPRLETEYQLTLARRR